MSRRVWVGDKPRPFHAVVPIMRPSAKDPTQQVEVYGCALCGEGWYWAKKPGTRAANMESVRRHFPGTFWQDDSVRLR